jgi:hypothetical protein
MEIHTSIKMVNKTFLASIETFMCNTFDLGKPSKAWTAHA